MKTQLPLFLLLILLGFSTTVNSQVVKKGENVGELYKVTDTVNGVERIVFYESQKKYEEIQQLKAKKIKSLKRQKRLYESDQRTRLADEIEDINARVDRLQNYTQEMAQADKESTAALYAKRIALHNEYIDSQIAFEQVNETLREDKFSVKFDDGLEVTFNDQEREQPKYVTTTNGLTLGFGYNFINGDDLGINDFSYPNNNYFSIGYQWKTALDKRQNIRFLYGIEYQAIGTELNGNRAFTTTDTDNTQIERLAFNADKAKFRQDQLVVPIHFEFGGTQRKEYEDGRVRYHENDKWKIGLGGYAGFNMSSRIKFKYEFDNEDIKEKIVNAFDNEVLLYGLDAYIGKNDLNLFGRVALNNIFKEGSVDGQYVSFGLRWHWM